MHKHINSRPEWATKAFTPDREDFIDISTSMVTVYDDEWYFEGPLGGFLSNMRIPRRIEIYCNMNDGQSLVRMSFEEPPAGKQTLVDGQNADGSWRVIYNAFETLSVAMLWNHEPETVFGLPSERIHIYLEPGDARVTFISVEDTLLDLFFKDGEFKMAPVDSIALATHAARTAQFAEGEYPVEHDSPNLFTPEFTPPYTETSHA